MTALRREGSYRASRTLSFLTFCTYYSTGFLICQGAFRTFFGSFFGMCSHLERFQPFEHRVIFIAFIVAEHPQAPLVPSNNYSIPQTLRSVKGFFKLFQVFFTLFLREDLRRATCAFPHHLVWRGNPSRCLPLSLGTIIVYYNFGINTIVKMHKIVSKKISAIVQPAQKRGPLGRVRRPGPHTKKELFSSLVFLLSSRLLSNTCKRF